MPDVNYDAYNPLTPKGECISSIETRVMSSFIAALLNKMQDFGIKRTPIQKSPYNRHAFFEERISNSHIADILVKNKVKIFPCDVGDHVYFIIEDTNETYISEDRITDVSTKGFFCSSTIGGNDSDDFYPYSDLGVSAFLDRVEAEQEMESRCK